MPYQPKSESGMGKFKGMGAKKMMSSSAKTTPVPMKDVKSTLRMPGKKGGIAAGVRMPRRPER